MRISTSPIQSKIVRLGGRSAGRPSSPEIETGSDKNVAKTRYEIEPEYKWDRVANGGPGCSIANSARPPEIIVSTPKAIATKAAMIAQFGRDESVSLVIAFSSAVLSKIGNCQSQVGVITEESRLGRPRSQSLGALDCLVVSDN